MLEYEQRLWEEGRRRVAGVDEAGRGPLAGPVVAAAAVFDPDFALSEQEGTLAGLTDSKQLAVTRRECFYALLVESPHVDIGVGVAEREEIDRLNILHATHAAMGRAVANLASLPDHILVDGLAVSGLPCPSTAIVKGDSKCLSIAAASVVAKVVRDTRMRELHRLYPCYGFDKNKGYGSQYHVRALLEHGPCPEHRRSFGPVRDAEDLRTRRQGELFG